MLDRRWARHLPDISSYAIAPDGSVVVASNADGLVQGLSEGGSILWRARFPRPVQCSVSAGGALCAAWVPDSAQHRTVIFLDRKGRTLHTATVPGPVRSVTVSSTGRVVCVLSDNATLTLIQRSERGWRWRRRRLSGAVSSFDMDSAGQRITVGRRDPAGVSLLDQDLKTVWHWVGREETTYQVQMGRRGGEIVALAQTGPGRVATALLWGSGSAMPRGSRALRGDLPHLALAPDASYMAAGYRARLWHGKKNAVEWRVTLYSSTLRAVWEVGGLVFGAHLIGVTDPPHLVLTHDGGRVLAALDSSGHMRARHRLASPVASTSTSADGKNFAVLTDARVLYLFRARR